MTYEEYDLAELEIVVEIARGHEILQRVDCVCPLGNRGRPATSLHAMAGDLLDLVG